MTRREVTRTLLEMERIREEIGEAGSLAEERRLKREYGRLWKSVQPYLPDANPSARRA